MDMEALAQDIQFQEHLAKLRDIAIRTGNEPFIFTNAGFFERGDVFEAQTVKGHTNYIVFAFVRNNWVYYLHGDRKPQKVRKEKFMDLIDYGDLVHVPKEKRDPERIALSVLALLAADQGLAFNDYLDQIHGYGPGSRV